MSLHLLAERFYYSVSKQAGLPVAWSLQILRQGGDPAWRLVQVNKAGESAKQGLSESEKNRVQSGDPAIKAL